MYDRLSAGNPFSRHSNIYIHTILLELKKHPKGITIKELESSTGIEISRIPGLIDLLENNKKIFREGSIFKFIPKYTIKKKEELLSVLKETKAAEGVSLEEILDSSSNTKSFVDELIKKEKAFLLKDIDGSSTLFYNPVQIKRASEEIFKLYEDVSVPEQRELVKILSSAGLITAETEKPARRTILQQKKKKYARKIKITNTHLNSTDLDLG